VCENTGKTAAWLLYKQIQIMPLERNFTFQIDAPSTEKVEFYSHKFHSFRPKSDWSATEAIHKALLEAKCAMTQLYPTYFTPT